MAAFTTAAIAVAGIGVSAYGMSQQKKALKAQQAAQDEATRIQQQQEDLRQRQMNLDAMRKQRETVRAGIQARGLALATATAQGAAGGSGLQGGYGQISGRTNVNALGISQNQEIGNAMFGLNRNLLSSYRAGAQAQTDLSTAQGLTSLGGQIVANAGSIGRVGTAAAGAVSNFANPTYMMGNTVVPNIGAPMSARFGYRG